MSLGTLGILIKIKEEIDRRNNKEETPKTPEVVKKPEELTTEELIEKLKQLLEEKRGKTPNKTQSQLNNDLDNMIFHSDTVTPLMRDVFELISESYYEIDDRPNEITLSNTQLKYNKEESDGLYSQYENEDTLLLTIHGAHDTKLNILAISQFLSPDLLNHDIQEFCKKYSKVRNDKRQIYLFGHSLGHWLTASCREFLNDFNVKGMFVAGYAPNKTSAQIFGITKSPKIKQLVFNNDWLATSILEVPGKRNILVFKPYDAFSNFNGHSINVYRKSPEILNSTRERFFP